jgi:hypothetical protein
MIRAVAKLFVWLLAAEARLFLVLCAIELVLVAVVPIVLGHDGVGAG